MNEFTMRKIVVVSLCLLPVLGRADAPAAVAAGAPSGAAAPAEAAPPPRWSFGGGIGYTFLTYAGRDFGVLLGTGPQAPSVPTVAASLERRMSATNWLVVGVSGAAARNRGDVPDGSSGVSRDDYRLVTASAGVRHWLTRRAAPVGVSLAVLAEGGVIDQDYRVESRYTFATPTVTRYDATSWFAGAQLGIAVERALTDGLSVRVASPLVEAIYGEGRVRTAGRPDVKSSNARAGVSLAPQLELRLLF